jgi:peptidoglycan/LPS O-acetylase OafA/YrhL
LAASAELSRRIPQLDGLRGVAIALVVIYHYVNYAADSGAPQFWNVLIRPTSLGWSGVDLFFVLSGFLIGGILLDARNSSNYFRVFYTRRLCRIFPLYFGFLAVSLAISHWSALRGIFSPPIPWSTLVTFTQNIWMAMRNQMGAGALNPTWSLAVEEQFYLTLPALIYFVRPARLIWIVTAGIVAAPLIRLGIYLYNPELTAAIYVLLPCRMDPLLLGVAVAYVLRRPGAKEYLRAHRVHLWTAMEVLTAVCFLFLIRATQTAPLTMLLGYSCLALLFTCVILLSLLDERLASALQARWLTGLGAISYGVYLLHPLVFGIFAALLRGRVWAGVISAALALPLTLLIASLSWICFEKPLVLQSHKMKYAGAPATPLSYSSVARVSQLDS